MKPTIDPPRELNNLAAVDVENESRHIGKDMAKFDVVYFSRNFPELSQTFVYNEMRGLRDIGVAIHVVAQKQETSSPSDLPKKYGFTDIRYAMDGTGRSNRAKRISSLLRNLFKLPLKASFRLLLSIAERRGIGNGTPLSTRVILATMLQPKQNRAIIHCHFGTAGLVIAQLKKAGLVDAPLTTVFHGYDLTQFMKDKRADIYDDLLEQADLLLPISDLWHRRLIELGASPKKIQTQRLGIDCSAFRFKERVKRHDAPLRFISVGRMTEKKGHRYVIEAFARLIANKPDLDVRLDMIGDGPLFENIRELADGFMLGHRLVLHGSVQHDEVRTLLNDAHIFVLPSVIAADGDMEGIPVAIMEAMALGLAVISTHHSGIPELVADGRSGLLVPERDVEALSAAMEALAEQPEKIASMGREGRAIIEENYDERKQAQKLFDALRSIS